MYNRFFLALQFKVYIDTDPDNWSEIIANTTIKVPGKAGILMVEVKVDPGADINCIPLHKFQCLFPHLCRHSSALTVAVT